MDFGTNPYDVAFFAFAPLAALVSLRLKRLAHIGVALVVIALVGWGLEFASLGWVDEQWASLIARTPNPSLQLLGQADADGGAKAAVLLLGFPASLVYTLICFVGTHGVRRFVNRHVRERK